MPDTKPAQSTHSGLHASIFLKKKKLYDLPNDINILIIWHVYIILHFMAFLN